jgi:hypothetical protein
LRLLGNEGQADYNSRAQFFAAASSSGTPRRKSCPKRGADPARRELNCCPRNRDDLLALDDALMQLAPADRAAAITGQVYLAAFVAPWVGLQTAESWDRRESNEPLGEKRFHSFRSVAGLRTPGKHDWQPGRYGAGVLLPVSSR